MQRLAGPVVVEFLHCFIASEVSAGVNGEKEWSSWCSRCKRLNVTRISGFWAYGLTEVNYFVKYFAMADGLEQVLTAPSWLVKLMGWLGGMRVRLPDRDLSRFQNFWGVALWEREETVDLHLVLAVSLMR